MGGALRLKGLQAPVMMTQAVSSSSRLPTSKKIDKKHKKDKKRKKDKHSKKKHKKHKRYASSSDSELEDRLAKPSHH